MPDLTPMVSAVFARHLGVATAEMLSCAGMSACTRQRMVRQGSLEVVYRAHIGSARRCAYDARVSLHRAVPHLSVRIRDRFDWRQAARRPPDATAGADPLLGTARPPRRDRRRGRAASIDVDSTNGCHDEIERAAARQLASPVGLG